MFDAQLITEETGAVLIARTDRRTTWHLLNTDPDVVLGQGLLVTLCGRHRDPGRWVDGPLEPPAEDDICQVCRAMRDGTWRRA